MADVVSEYLGQDALADRLRDQLGTPGTRAVRLTGPSGTGKSYVARELAEDWIRDGGAVVVCIGDSESAHRELLPWLAGLSRTPLDLGKLLEPGARSAIAVADTAAGTITAGTSIFDLLTSGRRQRVARLLNAYSPAEREVVLDLRRLARRRGLLVVADNAHWWDESSLRLLRQVLSDELREVLPELRSVVALVVDAAGEQTIVSPRAFHGVCEIVAATEETRRPTATEFPQLLSLFGFPAGELDHPLQHRLYLATGGHLKLIDQVATYAQQSTACEPFDDRYITDLLARRFTSLGVLAPEVTDVLIRASVLGLSFSEDDLACITGSERPWLRRVLRQAEAVGFVTRASENVHFSHDVVRAALLGDRSDEEVRILQAKLADCLAILRPDDYPSRAQALLASGDEDASREMTALALVARLRGGEDAASVIARLDTALNEPALSGYLRVVGAGYDAIARGDFESALPILNTSPSGETTLMAAERNYVAAICLMELQQTIRVADAVQTLQSWASELEGELELRLRYDLLLQQAHVLGHEFDMAREVELGIERRLLSRQRFDPNARALLAIQNRRSGAVNTPEIAEVRIEDSVAFFRSQASKSQGGALELYRALNNLAAIRLRLGKDDAALRAAREAEALALETPDIVKRADVLASNLVLAGLRAGAIDVVDAVERQRFIVDSPEGAEDKFIHRCNLAAYLLLARRDVEAETELGHLGVERAAGEFDESYLTFYWSALWTASAAISGDTESALRRHAKVDDFVAGLRWPTAGVVRRRHELMRSALEEFSAEQDRDVLDRLLIDRHPGEIGQAWAYYARAFPCCELSFWSDS